MRTIDPPAKPIVVNPVEQEAPKPKKIETIIIYILVVILGGGVFALLEAWPK